MAAHQRLVTLAGGAPGAIRSMASAYDTRGGNFYNGGAYIRACEAWGEALGIYRGLDKRGVLSEFDHKNGLIAISKRVASTCNPPRAGLNGRL